MPQIPPTSSSVREYSGAKRSYNSTSQANSLQSRQLPEKTANELRVGFDHSITPLKKEVNNASLFASNPASTFASTTDQYLDQTANALEQLKAIAIRSANESASDNARETLNREAKELVSLIGRIASTASLDENNLLDGSISNISFQVSLTSPTQKSIQGFNASPQALGIQPGVKQSTGGRIQLQNNVIGNKGIQEGNAQSNVISDFSIFIEGHNINESINIADQRYGGLLKNIPTTSAITDPTHNDFGSGVAKDIASRINALRDYGESSLVNIFASANTSFNAKDVSSEDFSGSVNTSAKTNIGLGSIDRGDLSINGIDVDRVAFLENDSAGTLVYSINAISALTGVKATTDAITGELSLEADDGRDIVINTGSTDTSNLIFGGGQSRFSQGFSDLRASGRITLSADNNLSFFGSSKSIAGFDEFSLDSTDGNQFTNDTIADTNLSSTTNAEAAVLNVSQALDQVNNFANKLSGLRTEFESTLQAFGSIYQQPRANSANAINSGSATRLAELSKNLIQQRVDTAVQAQANGSSQQILFYLR